MKRRFFAELRFARLLLVGVLAFCNTALLATPGRAETKRPIKLAVFAFELDDFSAGGPIAGESPLETARLRRVTDQARQLLAQSGLFELVDVGAATNEHVKAHWLRKCNGCDADVARELGAGMSFVGFFRKISVMEQYLEFRIRDARTGALVNVSQTDLRGETEESWSRAVAWLIRYRLVEPELARRSHEKSQ
jgi:hypothetical protein